jgi:ATP-dependent RNA helicase DDX10/DBP4
VPSSVNSFDYFPLSSPTLNGLHDSSYTIPTKIQCHSLGHSILGKDVVGAAKTGSGKTLALLIPV